MYKKIIDIEVNCDDEKLKKMIQNNLFTIEENLQKNENDEKDKEKEENNEVKDIQQKIEDCEMNNDVLIFELKQLNKQYEKLTKSKENSREKKQRYSFGSTMKSSNSNLIKISQSERKK